MDKLFIKGLMLEAIIGILPQERVEKQKVILDLELTVDIRQAAVSDNIEDTVNYAEIAESIKTWIDDTRYELLETLAEQIAQLIFKKFNIKGLKLTLCKPAAIPGAQGAGIIIERNHFKHK